MATRSTAQTDASAAQGASPVETKFQRTIDLLTGEFIDFAQDSIQNLGQLVAAVKGGETSGQAALDEVLRSTHNIKGSAGTFGYPLVGAIAHRLEDYVCDLGAIETSHTGDIQVFLDRMQDVLDGDPATQNAEAANIVRSLPAKGGFDVRDVARMNVEIMVIMPKDAAARFVERELRACGYRVTNVPAPFMAFELAVLTRPDMILVSAVFRDLSGVDVANALKAMPITRTIPVALITSLSADAHSLRELPAGVPLVRKGATFGEDLAKAFEELGIT